MIDDNWLQRLVEAREAHRAGQLDVARAAYDALLSAAPENVEVRGLLGVLTLHEGRPQEAEAQLRQAVAAGGDARIHLRNLNNLLALLQQSRNIEAARDLVAGDLPDWPEDTVPDATERQTVLSLCRALSLLDRAPAARALLDRAIPQPGDDPEACGLVGQILLALGEHAPAAEALGRAVELAPDDTQPLIALSYAQRQLGQPEAARVTAMQVARISPVYSAPRRPTQHATVLMLNPLPRGINNPNIDLRGLHFSANYGSQVASSMQDDFRFLSLFGDLPTEALPARLPQADVVLNNIVNSEPMNIPGRLDVVRAAVDRIRAPVINHPDQVFQTTRQKNELLLEGIPNLKVPRIRRYHNDPALREAIAAEIGADFDYPVILRKTHAHQSSDSALVDEGKSAVLLSTPVALLDHLQQCGWGEFYAVEFVNLKRKDGFYRQQRAVIIDGEIIVSRSSIYSEWAVTSWRSKAEGIEFYRANPHTIEECNRIVRDPEAHLGGQVLHTLGAIRDRIPLDMFGVDFEVDRDGRMVFFEAGAAMILQPLSLRREPLDVRLPMEPLIRIDEAFRELVTRRIAEPLPQPT